MKTGPLVVVGAGVAGTAAAWIARREGREVLVLDGGLGASGLGGGAVDDVPWEDVVRGERALGAEAPASPLDGLVRAFVDELGLWSVPAERRVLLATTAGRARPARGADRALLDLTALPKGARIGLPRADRAGWDAESLCRALGDERSVRARSFEVKPIDAVLVRRRGEEVFPDAERAALADDPAHLAWLAERLGEAVARTPVDAVLVGPWLGLDTERATELSRRVGIPVGEALSATSSTAGLRFERARDRLLARGGARVRRTRLTRLDAHAGRFELELPDGTAPLVAESVILAVGGLAGGGLVYAPAERNAGRDLPSRARVPFALSFDADLSLRGLGHALDVGGSLHGPDLDEGLWPTGDRASALERVGLAANPADGLRAVGDVVEGRPRTLLAAIASALASTP